MGLYFQGSAKNSIACAVMISWFIFVDGKQPQNPRKFEPLEIYYLYGIIIIKVGLRGWARWAMAHPIIKCILPSVTVL